MIHNKFLNLLNYRYNYLLLTVFIAIIGYQVRFIQDDAFISFRYADNFATGHGLTWNIGESPIEGYTNFLWVLFLSAGAYMGFDLISWSMILSIFSGIGTILVTYHLALQITSERKWALSAIFLLGTNYTFLAYMTGGLETQLNTFLIVFSLFLAQVAVMRKDYRILIPLSLVFSLCVLTRLDSVLFLVPIVLYMLWSFSHANFSKKDIIIRVGLLLVPFAFITAIWFTFKIYYYGDILPNTFYVKIKGVILYGIQYAYIFVAEYSFLIFIPLFFFFIRQLLSTGLLILLISIIVIWLAYIIKLGGGFMEFRFFVPILPILSILFTVILRYLGNLKIIIAVLFLLVSSSMAHALWFQGHSGMESIRSLNRHMYNKDINWIGVGKLLGESFDNKEGEPVKIAIAPAGAIPYYSKLYTIDMLGLNDRWIAKYGVVIGKRQGHYKFTTLEYLLGEEVNFVLGHPQVKPIEYAADPNPERFFNKKIDISMLPESSKILEIPVDSEYKLEVLYIKEHPLIENFIRENDIRPVPIEVAKMGVKRIDF